MNIINPAAVKNAETITSADAIVVNEVTRRKVTDIFTRDEIKMLTERSDLMGFLAIGFTWSVFALTFALLVWASHQSLLVAIPVFVLGFIVLGGRHLGLAILHHEAAHKTLFKTPWLNDVMGDWLCAKPIWNDVKKYRVHHFIHHTKTGSAEDTDISLIAPFPTTKASLARKFLRDLSGLTGLKYLLGRVLMDAGVLKWTVANDVVMLPQEGRRWWDYPREFLKNSAGMLMTNTVLLAVFWACSYPWLYAVWVISYLTPFPLFLRIRSMAEHACTETTPDMFRNTRSTRAGFIARATVAPIRVNFHIEHHVMASVPYFRLPVMHRMLRERGVLPDAPGYRDVLRMVSSGAAE
jgi:fatty acid desaturase